MKPIKKKPDVAYVYITADYLYKEGKKFYTEAIKIEFPEKENLNATKENYFKSIIYFQGAMILGNQDACAYLSEFYNNNQLGINDKNVSDLTKIMGIENKTVNYFGIRHSLCLRKYKVDNNAELEDCIILDQIRHLKNRILTWANTPVPEYLVLDNVKDIIKKFNSTMPTEYHLPTDESIFEYDKELNTFTLLEDNSKTQSTAVIPKEQTANYANQTQTIGDLFESINMEESCTIS